MDPLSLLNIGAFEIERVLDFDPRFLEEDDDDHHDHEHTGDDCSHESHHHHDHEHTGDDCAHESHHHHDHDHKVGMADSRPYCMVIVLRVLCVFHCAERICFACSMIRVFHCVAN